jgi:tetratricopeptide (TPR) repeat protein
MAGKKDKISQSDEHNARGIELADRGWLDEAVNEFKKAIDLDPDSAHAFDNLATVFAEKGRFVDALEAFVKAVRLEPDNANVYHYLASFLSSRGFDAAVALYKQTLEIDHEYVDAHVNLALTYGDRGMLDEATEALLKAVEIDPADEAARHELAAVLMDSGRHAEAIGHLRRIIKEYPDHTDAYVDLGVAYTAQGFYREAERSLLDAVKMQPELASAHYHLGSLYFSWEKPDTAFEHLGLAMRLDRENVMEWLEDDGLMAELEADPKFLALVGETTKVKE